MVFDPVRQTIGGVPIGAIYAAQREEEQRRAARKAAFEAAATAMRETGALCDIRFADGSDNDHACRVPAAGRCSVCSRAFCLSHRSSDVGKQFGGTFYAATDLCAECQQRQIAEANRAQEEHAKEYQAKLALEAEAAATLRAEQERQNREHAERVAAHELQTNWAATKNYMKALEARIERIPKQGNVRPAIAWIGIPVLFFTILVATILIVPSSGLNNASPIGFVYFIAAAILTYGIWALIKRTRRSIRTKNLEELRTLGKSRDRGCGETECRRCYNSL
jgi:hypothetical protein